jgi:hypothetical protein
MQDSLETDLTSEERQWLYRYVEESVREEESFHCLEFEYLQRLNIVHFQLKLAKLKGDCRSQGKHPDSKKKLSETLKDYSTHSGLDSDFVTEILSSS